MHFALRCGTHAESWRLHLLMRELEPQKIYCDLRFDGLLHFLRLGVDYRKIPADFYEHVLREKLESNGFQSKVMGGFSWLTRKNKALGTGLRL